MKKLLFVLLAVTLLFGCAGLQLTENQDFAVKKIARIAGITLALEKPGEIEKALTYVEYLEGIENTKIKEAALAVAVEYIYKEYGKTNKTVILVAEVIDLLQIIVPEGSGDIQIPESNLKLLNAALASFKEGLLLAK